MNLEYKLIKASQIEDFHRPYWWLFPGDTDKNVAAFDVRVLRSHANKLYRNLGPLRVAIQEKAMYAIGRHWNPKYIGDDSSFGTEATTWLQDNWYPMCNVLGPEFDFQLTLFIMSVNLDVFGEYFIYLTEQDNGYPAIQGIPAHRVDQPRQSGAIGNDGKLTGFCFGGAYKGYECKMGVIKNDQGRPIAYHVWGNSIEQDRIVSADDLIRIREVDLGDETRSIPTYSHGINQGRSILSLLENEQEFLEAASRIALIENNELGGIDPNDPSNTLAIRPSVPTDIGDGASQQQGTVNGKTRTMWEEWRQQAETRYLKANTGSKIEAFQFTRPGGEWQVFMSKLCRFLIDPVWPYYLVENEGEMSGANSRGLVARCNRIIQDRQDTIKRVARKLIQYAVAKGAKIKRISKSDDWYNWDFTLPARITVDFGKDSKAEVMEIQAGILEPGEVIEARGGGTYEDWLTKAYRNQALDIKIRKQIQAESGEQLEPLAKPLPGSGSSQSSSGSGGGKADEVDD